MRQPKTSQASLKLIRFKRATVPFKRRLMLGVRGVEYGFNKIQIALLPADVLRWAGSHTIDAKGQRKTKVDIKYFFDLDLMHPVVAKVIGVFERGRALKGFVEFYPRFWLRRFAKLH